jgi:TDG/mug DNA glycosylase family protein
MTTARGFPPVSEADATVLILGSLPGRRSLELHQYYGQARNAFWPIMGRLFGAGPELTYEERLGRLMRNAIALWDVVASGERIGSLDAAIIGSSVVVNDFDSFFRRHPDIRLVCFNGRKAEQLYRRSVAPALGSRLAAIRHETLPSTSAAHAALSFDEKLRRWSSVVARASLRRRAADVETVETPPSHAAD